MLLETQENPKAGQCFDGLPAVIVHGRPGRRPMYQLPQRGEQGGEWHQSRMRCYLAHRSYLIALGWTNARQGMTWVSAL